MDYNPNGKSTYVAISKFGLGHQTAIKTEPVANVQDQYQQENGNKLPEVPLLGVKKEIFDETTNIEEIGEDEWSTDEEGGSSADEEQQR